MSPAQRKHYFGLWIDVCAAKGWKAKDDARRREATLDCMRAVGGPVVGTSNADFSDDEITALFCYLDHLADRASLDKSARWVTCQEDYRAFSRARHADWHERETYGKGKNKLDRDRFKGEATAVAGPLDPLNQEQVRKRHITMASRHRQKLAREAEAARATAAGRDLASHAPASPADAGESGGNEPAYVPPADGENPF